MYYEAYECMHAITNAYMNIAPSKEYKHTHTHEESERAREIETPNRATKWIQNRNGGHRIRCEIVEMSFC